MNTILRSLLLAMFLPALVFASQASGQVIPVPGDPVEIIWTKAMNDGVEAIRIEKFTQAESAFRRAAEIREPERSGDIRHCQARLFLAEALFELGRADEALRLTEDVVAQAKGASKPVPADGNSVSGMSAQRENIFRFQTAAALYLRAARLFARMNAYDRGEPLFDLARRLFDQPVRRGEINLTVHKPVESITELPETQFPERFYCPDRELRIAETWDAKTRFYLLWGKPALAFKTLKESEKSRSRSKSVLASRPPRLPFPSVDMVDPFMVERLDTSLVRRVMRDLNFLRISDEQAVRLLEQYAVMLRKVRRVGDAEAFLREARDIAPSR